MFRAPIDLYGVAYKYLCKLKNEVVSPPFPSHLNVVCGGKGLNTVDTPSHIPKHFVFVFGMDT